MENKAKIGVRDRGLSTDVRRAVIQGQEMLEMRGSLEELSIKCQSLGTKWKEDSGRTGLDNGPQARKGWFCLEFQILALESSIDDVVCKLGSPGACLEAYEQTKVRFSVPTQSH